MEAKNNLAKSVYEAGIHHGRPAGVVNVWTGDRLAGRCGDEAG